ncbi:MAG: cytochrome C assembly protein [SAR202 cluster bacterium]|nr:cytochrome C assembly protein [SAR202 cluster bacterium]|tara:strand:+ start:48006 stop:48692 length:687 start_codon:yes stop_codon:yes gene_type:complete
MKNISISEIFWIFSFIFLITSLGIVFMWAPTDVNLGVSQKIFYLHLPTAILGMISIVIVAFLSILYLLNSENNKWDDLAYSFAEVGMIFLTIALISGSLWSKPAWGVWWTWEPKLTLTLALWFVYVAYLMMRSYMSDLRNEAKFGAIVALIGSIDAPLIYYATELWRSAHPGAVVGPNAEPGALDERMFLALILSFIAFSFMFIFFVSNRYFLRKTETRMNMMVRKLN